MKLLSRVVWSEGMYLGPHHFQVQNRYFEDSIRFAASSLWFSSFGLAGVELKVLMVLLACPTAIISYTMVLELKGDETLASGSIIFSVLTSIVSLAIIIGAF